MSQFTLDKPAFMLPTPAGAYHVACTQAPETLRYFLFNMMGQQSSQWGDELTLQRWHGGTATESLELLYHLHQRQWVIGESQQRLAPIGPLPDITPTLLEPLSALGHALLADEQGIYIATAGFHHETAEELAALSGDLLNINRRHGGLLQHNLGMNHRGWALSDASGHSQLGVWPIIINELAFTLVIKGMPNLNQVAFRDLIWTLTWRYWQS